MSSSTLIQYSITTGKAIALASVKIANPDAFGGIIVRESK